MRMRLRVVQLNCVVTAWPRHLAPPVCRCSSFQKTHLEGKRGWRPISPDCRRTPVPPPIGEGLAKPREIGGGGPWRPQEGRPLYVCSSAPSLHRWADDLRSTAASASDGVSAPPSGGRYGAPASLSVWPVGTLFNLCCRCLQTIFEGFPIFLVKKAHFPNTAFRLLFGILCGQDFSIL